MVEASAPKTPRLELLDGLRGIAAICVVFHHEFGIYHSSALFSRAYLAVDFFFMLSGFVLTLVYERRLQAGLGPGTFIGMRIMRLWPVLAVGILVAGYGALLSDGLARALCLIVLSLALIPVIEGTGGIYQLNGPQWSVSFELIANYVHALLLRRLGDGALLLVAAICGLILAAQARHWGTFGTGDIVQNWSGGFARVGFSYTIGIWLGRQFMKGRAQFRFGQLWWLAIVPVPTILLLAPAIPLPQYAGDALAVFLLMPPALWLAAHAKPARAIRPVLDWLGRISYPIYATHLPIISLVARHAQGLSSGRQVVMRIAAMATIFAFSWLLAESPLGTGDWRKSRIQASAAIAV